MSESNDKILITEDGDGERTFVDRATSSALTVGNNVGQHGRSLITKAVDKMNIRYGDNVVRQVERLLQTVLIMEDQIRQCNEHKTMAKRKLEAIDKGEFTTNLSGNIIFKDRELQKDE